ncbi:hypothetical protein CR513_47680, partial [Mucuna pruriens]
MKYLARKEVGRVWADHRVVRLRIGSQLANKPEVNVLDLDLDPRCDNDRERPLPAEDLKEINIDLDPTHKMKIRIALMQEDENRLISFLFSADRLMTEAARGGEEKGRPGGN